MKNAIDYHKWEWVTKVMPKKLFNKPTMLINTGIKAGFAINLITVRFFRNSNSMEVNHFSNEGKVNTSNYLFPDTEAELLSRLKFHCGESDVNANIKS